MKNSKKIVQEVITSNFYRYHVSDDPKQLLEGPVYAKGLGLSFVDIANERFYRFNPLTETMFSEDYNEKRPSAVVINDYSAFVVERSGLHRAAIDQRSDQVADTFRFVGPIVQHFEKNSKIRTNDAKVGLDGSIWVGTMADPPIYKAGALWRVSVEGEYAVSTLVRDGVTISNGIAWTSSPFGFYYIDTQTKNVDFCSVNENYIRFKRAFSIDPEYGSPDGMTIDADGNLFIAMWGGGCILKIEPRRGSIIEKISIPAKYVTSCIFGGDDYSVLYVTTATWNSAGESESQPEDDFGGCLFSITDIGRGNSEPNPSF